MLPQGEHVSAFMPCTPNPTTGFFFYVLRKDLIVLDISVENAMTLLISAGMVQPDGDAQKKLAALAATAKAAQAAKKTEASGIVIATAAPALQREGMFGSAVHYCQGLAQWNSPKPIQSGFWKLRRTFPAAPRDRNTGIGCCLRRHGHHSLPELFDSRSFR